MLFLFSASSLIWGALLDCREQNITVHAFIHFAFHMDIKALKVHLLL